MLLTRLPLPGLYHQLIGDRVQGARLACIRHTANVNPELESNSSNKNLSVCSEEQDSSIFISLLLITEVISQDFLTLLYYILNVNERGFADRFVRLLNYSDLNRLPLEALAYYIKRFLMSRK